MSCFSVVGSSLLVVVGGAGIPRIVAQTRIEATLFLGAVVLAVAAAALTVGAMLRDAALAVSGTGVAAVAALVFGGAEILAVVALRHSSFSFTRKDSSVHKKSI